jgi:hypothetical protein
MYLSTLRLAVVAAAMGTMALMTTARIASAEQNAPTAVERPNAAPAQAPPTTADGPGCNTLEKPANAGGGSLDRAAGQGLQQKNWQAAGGEIQFNVKSFAVIPASASVVVCFRWKGNDQAPYFAVRPHFLDLSSDGKILKVTTSVPRARDINGEKKEFMLIVPLAEVRILAIPPAGAVGTDGKPFATTDVIASIGVTSVFWALVLALLIALLAYGALSLVCRRRMQPCQISVFNPICIITLPSGYASLSQFQVMVWTFVVGASAVYVMALSGELIEVTSGTLVLLGISGAAAIGAKWHNEATSAPAPRAPAAPEPAMPSPPAPAPAGEPAPVVETPTAPVKPAPAPAVAVAPAAVTRRPRWSDLVISEVVENGVVKRREIDVSRVQMLYFTLITASFAVLKVLTTYVIPEIPDGFQVLLGISNAVYMGSKVAQKPTDGKPQ